MPIYEFQCTRCQHKFERLCAVGEDGSTLSCPQCGQPAPRRLLSVFAACSKGQNGLTTSFRGSTGGSNCGSCSGGSCSTCGH